ncbi:MAG: hypothetical protein WCI73_01395 [Phycisphaerae bacterium]
MTTALEKAFAKAASLPSQTQNQLARQLMADITAETKWDSTLAKSQNMLEKMAQKAKQAHKAGKTQRLGFDDRLLKRS